MGRYGVGPCTLEEIPTASGHPIWQSRFVCVCMSAVLHALLVGAEVRVRVRIRIRVNVESLFFFPTSPPSPKFQVGTS